MSPCIKTTNVFEEAINHSRWKDNMKSVVKTINLKSYKNKTFNEIYSSVYNNIINIKGIGMLAVYDIVSGICSYYNINIDKVFIVGKGPKRAIKLLNIETKNYTINDKINLKYVEISDVINAFRSKNINVDEKLINTSDGDMVESYICNWQKEQK